VSWRANHARGSLAVGGHLWLSASRLDFAPNAFERLVRRSPWTCDLQSITKVGVADRGVQPLAGGLRKRLLIEHDDEVDLFVVSHVEDIVVAIDQARATA
jgi:hypothetical protein